MPASRPHSAKISAADDEEGLIETASRVVSGILVSAARGTSASPAPAFGAALVWSSLAYALWLAHVSRDRGDASNVDLLAVARAAADAVRRKCNGSSGGQLGSCSPLRGGGDLDISSAGGRSAADGSGFIGRAASVATSDVRWSSKDFASLLLRELRGVVADDDVQCLQLAVAAVRAVARPAEEDAGVIGSVFRTRVSWVIAPPPCDAAEATTQSVGAEEALLEELPLSAVAAQALDARWAAIQRDAAFAEANRVPARADLGAPDDVARRGGGRGGRLAYYERSVSKTLQRARSGSPGGRGGNGLSSSSASPSSTTPSVTGHQRYHKITFTEAARPGAATVSAVAVDLVTLNVVPLSRADGATSGVYPSASGTHRKRGLPDVGEGSSLRRRVVVSLADLNATSAAGDVPCVRGQLQQLIARSLDQATDSSSQHSVLPIPRQPASIVHMPTMAAVDGAGTAVPLPLLLAATVVDTLAGAAVAAAVESQPAGGRSHRRNASWIVEGVAVDSSAPPCLQLEAFLQWEQTTTTAPAQTLRERGEGGDNTAGVVMPHRLRASFVTVGPPSGVRREVRFVDAATPAYSALALASLGVLAQPGHPLTSAARLVCTAASTTSANSGAAMEETVPKPLAAALMQAAAAAAAECDDHHQVAPSHPPEVRMTLEESLEAGGAALESLIRDFDVPDDSIVVASGAESNAASAHANFFVAVENSATDSISGGGVCQLVQLPRYASACISFMRWLHGASRLPASYGLYWRSRRWRFDAVAGVLIPWSAPSSAALSQATNTSSSRREWLWLVEPHGPSPHRREDVAGIPFGGRYSMPAVLAALGSGGDGDVAPQPVRVPWHVLEDGEFPTAFVCGWPWGEEAADIMPSSAGPSPQEAVPLSLLDIPHLDRERVLPALDAFASARAAIQAGRSIPRASLAVIERSATALNFFGLKKGAVMDAAAAATTMVFSPEAQHNATSLSSSAAVVGASSHHGHSSPSAATNLEVVPSPTKDQNDNARHAATPSPPSPTRVSRTASDARRGKATGDRRRERTAISADGANERKTATRSSHTVHAPSTAQATGSDANPVVQPANDAVSALAAGHFRRLHPDRKSSWNVSTDNAYRPPSRLSSGAQEAYRYPVAAGVRHQQ